MKKALTIASLLVLTAILGFSNTSWAANRPDTSECTDINGRADVDACLIQYIEPLKMETEQMWNRLLKLQGKSVEENPWTFKIDSPVCDPDSQYYDATFCLLQTPGKLALEKYRLREEVVRLAIEQKLKRQKTKLAVAQAAIDKLANENERLTQKLAEAERTNAKLLKHNYSLIDSLVTSDKVAEDQVNRIKNFKDLFIGFLITTIALAVFCILLIVFPPKIRPVRDAGGKL